MRTDQLIEIYISMYNVDNSNFNLKFLYLYLNILKYSNNNNCSSLGALLLPLYCYRLSLKVCKFVFRLF